MLNEYLIVGGRALAVPSAAATRNRTAGDRGRVPIKVANIMLSQKYFIVAKFSITGPDQH